MQPTQRISTAVSDVVEIRERKGKVDGWGSSETRDKQCQTANNVGVSCVLGFSRGNERIIGIYKVRGDSSTPLASRQIAVALTRYVSTGDLAPSVATVLRASPRHVAKLGLGDWNQALTYFSD